MARSIELWVGKNDDVAIPVRVKLRIFERYGGLCYKTGVRLLPGRFAYDHIVALIDGGSHSEDNLAPIAIQPHKEKTAQEAGVRKTVRKKKAKHLGLKKSKNPLPGGKNSKYKKLMSGKVVLR